ncbi:SGNH/GDSL hydrolase family protein [Blastopirellula sp. J2-11]|uniref:SGNH/GDSL hydrolase family protein n=1 Tax=Blastopirellula sp. J2-11 TaxID=2943192 RepID=UPI0021C9E6F7|nr:SGNH/GDSL hydrolase family protein [Blastopirellula sp. J2-11]UUO08536.1 SGNH/GDSL hydrolase family protein [Blastopirellula sp. J2-11]
MNCFLRCLIVLLLLAVTAQAQTTQTPSNTEPTNADEAAAQKLQEAAELEKKYQAWFATLTPDQQAWENTLQAELGGFYLPIHKREKVAGKSNAWDFVTDDPALPRVLLIGDSVSRAYTQTVRKELAGIANVHRAPANCGPTATGLKKLDVWLGDDKWDLIHFNFGIHDRATPLTDYAARLEQLVERMQKTGAKVAWASSTPIPDVPGKFTAKSMVERNATAAKVMKEHGVAIDDLFTAITPRLEELQNPNDVHFTSAGNQFLGEQVATFLKASLPQKFHLSVRASEINPDAQAHPELGFIFQDDKGKPQDVQHAMVDTRAAQRGKLVIWLMGYNGGLFDRITSYGLHGIQPHYANRWFGTLKAKDRDDGVSLGKIRLEAATGEDSSPLVDIPKADSMAQRSLQLVKWLAKENPAGNWGQFLNEDKTDLQWDKVIMAGSSHGSTTSARFAKHQKVARVVMFCGPRDQLDSWQGLPSATPENRYFGFSHVLDGGWTGDHYCRSWQMLGLNKFGPIVDVDQVPAPYESTRRLITAGDVKNDARRAHGSVTPGGSAIKDADGNYVHEAVWRYLFTHPVDEVGEAVPAEMDCNLDLKK